MAERTVRGATSADVVEERSRRRAEDLRPGSRGCRAVEVTSTSTASQNETRSGIRSQCYLRSNS